MQVRLKEVLGDPLMAREAKRLDGRFKHEQLDGSVNLMATGALLVLERRHLDVLLHANSVEIGMASVGAKFAQRPL